MQIAGPGQGLSNPDAAIFTSHNQKVVENANGIFCTFNGIILDRSTNGGQTFSEVYNLGATNTAKAPSIESDEPATGAPPPTARTPAFPIRQVSAGSRCRLNLRPGKPSPNHRRRDIWCLTYRRISGRLSCRRVVRRVRGVVSP